MDKSKTKEKKKNKSWILPLSIGAICLASGFGINALLNIGKHRLSYDEQKLIEGYRLLKDEWLFGNEYDYLNSNAMKGMISSVSDEKGDPYTFYTDSDSEQGLSTDGSGFGFSSHYYNGGLYVTEIHPESPAEKATFDGTQLHLRIGDVVYGVQVDNDSYFDFTKHTQKECQDYLDVNKGNVTYHFQVVRGEEKYTLSLKKGVFQERLIRVVQSPSVENNNTLMIKINTFLGDPYSALVGTLNAYKNSVVNHLVLDLRQNGGGYVNQAEMIAKLFVKKGTLIDRMIGKDNKVISECYQTKEPVYQFDHYSILIDSQTASAAESFTLAMRAGTNAKIYGLTSYGKGIAQAFKTFEDGSVIRYTYSYVYGPERSNETMYNENQDSDDILCIHKKGIVPDVMFSKNYTYLNSVLDYTNTMGITETGQQLFLQALNDIHPNVYPQSYSASYHFTDAIQDYGNNSAILYKDETYKEAFDEKGYFSPHLNHLFIKECYDTYLKYEAILTNEVIEGQK